MVSRLEAIREARPKSEFDKDGVDRSVYSSSLWNSSNPRAEALNKLDPRAPSAPGCPGTEWLPISDALGALVPDLFGRVFHPNIKDHNVMASFALAYTMDLRAKKLGVQPDICIVTSEFRCWKKEGRKGYANADKLDENYKKFCEQVEPPGDDITGWRRAKKYQERTADEHEFVVEASELVSDFNKEECLDSMKRIIHGCDGNDPENPMNWKSGGRYKRGDLTYEVNPTRENRPWPPPKKVKGSCKYWYHFFYSDYIIRGAGWSTWDWGQKTLLAQAKDCLGEGVTEWKFEYFDKPDENGMEWKSSFRTPVFVANRCFKNNKVAFGSGGFTDGCEGSGWA